MEDGGWLIGGRKFEGESEGRIRVSKGNQDWAGAGKENFLAVRSLEGERLQAPFQDLDYLGQQVKDGLFKGGSIPVFDFWAILHPHHKNVVI